MTNPSPHNLQLRKWILDHLTDSDEFISAVEDNLVEILGTILTTRGDLLTRDGTGVIRLAKGAQNTLLNMGANDPAWQTLSTILDNVIGSTRGALLMRGSSGWAKIDPGTSGFSLTSNGTNADPTYQDKSGSVKFLSSQTASNSTSLDFTSGIDSTHNNYRFVLENVLGASTSTLQLLVSTDNGSNWKSSSYVGAVATNTNAVQLAASNMSTTAGYGFCGTIQVANPSNASVYKLFNGFCTYFTSINGMASVFNGGAWTGGTDAINGVRFVFGSGNITSGTIRLYGLKGS